MNAPEMMVIGTTVDATEGMEPEAAGALLEILRESDMYPETATTILPGFYIVVGLALGKRILSAKAAGPYRTRAEAKASGLRFTAMLEAAFAPHGIGMEEVYNSDAGDAEISATAAIAAARARSKLN